MLEEDLKFKFDDETIDIDEFGADKTKPMDVNIKNHGEVNFVNFGADCVQVAHIDNLVMPKKKNRKKIGDLTLREVEEMCSKRDDNDNGCRGCPLEDMLFCPTIQKEILDDEVEVEK